MCTIVKRSKVGLGFFVVCFFYFVFKEIKMFLDKE